MTKAEAVRMLITSTEAGALVIQLPGCTRRVIDCNVSLLFWFYIIAAKRFMHF